MAPARHLRVFALALLVAAGACGDDDDSGPTTSTTTTTAPPTDGSTAPPTPTTAAPTTELPPAGNRIEVDVVGGEPVGGVRDVAVPLGEEVELFVTADVEDEVHVHCYDLTAAIAPGEPAEILFDADIPGQCEVELEGSGTLILNLVVS